METNPNFYRRGRLRIPEPMARAIDFPKILAAAQFVPLRVEYHYVFQSFEYVGCSPLFRELEQSEPTPQYTWRIYGRDGEIESVQAIEA